MSHAHRRWSLPGLDDSGYVIARAGAARIRKGWSAVPGLFAGTAVESWLASHPSILHEIHEAIGGTRRAGLLRSGLAQYHREIGRRLGQAFRSGELVAFRRTPPSIARSGPEESQSPEPSAPGSVVEEPDNYVGIRLVGEDGNGVPGVRYRVVLPDSSVREGTLDGGGSAVVRGKFSGTCKVSFPELDPSAWDPA